MPMGTPTKPTAGTWVHVYAMSPLRRTAPSGSSRTAVPVACCVWHPTTQEPGIQLSPETDIKSNGSQPSAKSHRVKENMGAVDAELTRDEVVRISHAAIPPGSTATYTEIAQLWRLAVGPLCNP